MLKTLIVEDNPFNRDTLKELFTRHFSAVIVEGASGGREAMQKLESFQPDLILMAKEGSITSDQKRVSSFRCYVFRRGNQGFKTET